MIFVKWNKPSKRKRKTSAIGMSKCSERSTTNEQSNWYWFNFCLSCWVIV